jgi:hypothetical protein
MIKSFRQDIITFKEKLLKKENFTFSKYADGEWAVMQNHAINNKEFWFDPNSETDQFKRQALIDSFKYKHPNYYVGVSCPCCQGTETFNQMVDFSEQDDNHLTWANLWVNSNYKYYVSNILPLYRDRNVVLFCNENGRIDKLPFRPYMVVPLKNNAWEYNWNLIHDAKELVSKIQEKNMLFLFCCGPFGNILCHQLTQHNDQHTYLDIGSTLNPFLGSAGFERYYYMGDNVFSNSTCIWGK